MYLINRHKMWNVDFEQIENRQELVTLKAEDTLDQPACWLDSQLSAAGTAPNSLKLERLCSVEETHSKRAHQLKSADAKGSIRGSSSGSGTPGLWPPLPAAIGLLPTLTIGRGPSPTERFHDAQTDQTKYFGG